MFEKLFGNPGQKLHVIENIIFCLFVIVGTVIGFMFAFVFDDVIIMLPIGIAGGFLIGWLNGLSLHIFADIAENLYHINKNVYTTTDIIEKKIITKKEKLYGKPYSNFYFNYQIQQEGILRQLQSR